MKTAAVLLTALCLVTATSIEAQNLPAQALTAQAQHPVVLMKTELGDITIELWPDKTPKTVDNFIGLAMGTKKWQDPKGGEWVQRPFYDGLIFHRVIDDFMIQGGCPTGDGHGSPGYRFGDECYERGDPITGKIEDEQSALLVYNQVLVPYFQSTTEPDSSLLKTVNACQVKKSGKPIMEHTVEYYLDKTGTIEPVFPQGKLISEVGYATICMANSGANTNGSQFFIVTKKEGCDWQNGKHTVFGNVVGGMDVVHAIEKQGKGVKIISVRTREN